MIYRNITLLQFIFNIIFLDYDFNIVGSYKAIISFGHIIKQNMVSSA